MRLFIPVERFQNFHRKFGKSHIPKTKLPFTGSCIAEVPRDYFTTASINTYVVFCKPEKL